MKKRIKPAKKGNLLRCFRKDLSAWMLLAPFLILLIFIVWRPNIQGFIWSFFEMRGYTPVEFAGLKNYRIVLGNTDFLMTLGNTLKYVGISIVLGYFLPIVVAILINELTIGKGTFKFIFYLPGMVPGIAVSMLWYYIYYPNNSGLLNMLLGCFGIESRTWLGNPDLTILMILISCTWSGLGGAMILYLAALQGVNKELYEAAVMDGAGFLRRVWHITIPGIGSVMILQLVRQIISIFQIVQEPLAMTGGGPNNASITLGLLAYRYAFKNFQVGNALALNVIMFLILVLLTAFYFKLQKIVDDYV